MKRFLTSILFFIPFFVFAAEKPTLATQLAQLSQPAYEHKLTLSSAKVLQTFLVENEAELKARCVESARLSGSRSYALRDPIKGGLDMLSVFIGHAGRFPHAAKVSYGLLVSDLNQIRTDCLSENPK